MRIDGKQLVQCINFCLDLSMDGRLTDQQQSEALALAKRLRGSLMNLLTAEFPKDSVAVKEATEKLKSANEMLKQTKEQIDKFANTVAAVNEVLSKLDGLLSIVGKFL